MKKLRYLLALLLAMALIGLTACGSKTDDSETIPETSSETEVIQEPEAEPQDITLEDLDPLAEGGILTGIEDLKIEEGTEVDLNELVFMDGRIILGVDIDDNGVDYGKPGTYEAIYTVAFDGEALCGYLEENDLEVSFDTEGDTVIVKTVVTVEILTKEEAEETVKEDGTGVVTEDTKSDVQKSNKTQAVQSAQQSTGSNKSSSSGSSGNGSKSGSSDSSSKGGSSSSGSSSSSSGSSSGKSSSSGSSSIKHTHSYTSKVTKKATCGSAGVKNYTCSCGDSYTESIPATGNHSWAAQTEQVWVDDGQVWVVDQAAWDERVVTGYNYYDICNGCGATFPVNSDEGYLHDCPAGYGGISTKKEAIWGTKHHDEVGHFESSGHYETKTTGYKCSVCGATK